MTDSSALSHLIEPGIHVGYVNSLLEFLQGLGLPRHQVLQWMPDLRVELQQDWIKARHLNELYLRAGLVLQNPHLGLHFGHQASAGSFRMVGFLAVSAPDLLSSLQTVLHYQSLYSRIGKMVLRRQESCLSLCWDAIWPRQWMAPAAVEASIAGWHHLGLNMLGHKINAAHVTFKHANQGDLALYERAFGCPVYFGSEYDAIYLNQKDLACAVPESDQLVHETLLEKSSRILAVRDDEPFVDRVEQVLKLQGQGRILAVEDVADYLSLSAGELRRLLKKSNLGYRILCDRAKFLESLELILQQEVDFVDIALQLGFAEQSVFTRAFRRWTGMSPLAYRKRLRRALPV